MQSPKTTNENDDSVYAQTLDWDRIADLEIEQARRARKKSRTVLKVVSLFVATCLVVSVCIYAGQYLMIAPNDNTSSGTSSSTTENVDVPELALESVPEVEESTTTTVTGEYATEEIVAMLSPCVVRLEVSYTSEFYAASSGSGVVMSEDGYIITNSHVVVDEDTGVAATTIMVTFDDGSSAQAELVGADTKTDLAVIKVNAEGLDYATFGDSDEILVGQRAIVIGSPGGEELASSVTQGVISGVNRNVTIDEYSMTLIQTDAAVNPGNSGGALINAYGQVVGIVSAKLVQTGYEGIGFAIPMNTVKEVVDDIISYGYVTDRVRIGIAYQVIDSGLAAAMDIPVGLRVVSVSEDAGAYGLVQEGDIITKIDGVDCDADIDIASILAEYSPGDQLLLEVYRIEDDALVCKSISIALTEDLTYAIQYAE